MKKKVVSILACVIMSTLLLTGSTEKAKAYVIPEGETILASEYKEYLEKICDQYSICPDLMIALIERESGCNPKDVSPTGCKGLCQISAYWNRDRMERLGCTDVMDPYQNMLIAVDLISELGEKYEDPAEALMYYNEGYNGIRKYEKGEISKYAEKILIRAYDLERIREWNELEKGARG